MEYNIEKGVPIPPKGRIKYGKRLYPWLEMEIGDSFFVPRRADEVPDQTMRRMQPTCSGAAGRYKRKFAIRTVEGGARIWRTE